MGSTGRGLFLKSNTGNVNDETFGIKGAVNFKGKVPADSMLEEPGDNKITIKVPSFDKANVFFQFKLNKRGDKLNIIGFKDDYRPIKVKLAVDVNRPSIGTLAIYGNKSEKLNAMRLRDLFARSTEVSEAQLLAIANKLLEKRKSKGG